jgi:hypothetical protein
VTDFEPGLAARLDRRAARGWPRMTVALAAAGCALIVVGVVAFGGADLGEGGLDGDAARLPGTLLSLAVAAGGFFLVARAPSAPLRTAGVVASALGVPAALIFVSFDEGSLLPFSPETVLIGSTAAWGLSYRFGPGRGRTFYLGAALVGGWLAILELIESVFSYPFFAIEGFFEGLTRDLEGGFTTVPTPSFPGATPTSFPRFTVPIGDGAPSPELPSGLGRVTDVPDATTIAILSLLFGITYVLVGRWLDRRGFAGEATPFAFAGVVALFVGIAAFSEDIDAAGAGLLFVVVGLLLAAYGASAGRRGTTWWGGGAVFVGAFVIVGDAAGDSERGFGALAVVLGAGAVALAHAIARSTREPADDEPGPSFGAQPSGVSSQRPLPLDGGGVGRG